MHCWGGNPDRAWYPWLKQELEKREFVVQVPQMPNTDAPEIDKWIDHLTEVIGEVDANTYLVGHSLGCQSIMRYLAGLPDDKRIGGAVLVAGFFTLTNMDDVREIAEPWLALPMDYARIRQVCPRLTAIFSDNDDFVPLENIDLFKERLQPKIIIREKQGHFSVSTNTTELPVALDELLEM